MLTTCYVDIENISLICSDTECGLNSSYRRYVHIEDAGVDFNTVTKHINYNGNGTRAPRATLIRH